MTYSAAEIVMEDPVFVSTLGPSGIGNWVHSTRQAAPASFTPTTNRRIFHPFWLNSSYIIRRFWWLNGSVVGTDYVEIGVFDQDLNLVACSPRTLSAGTVSQVQYATAGNYAAVLAAAQSSVDASTRTVTSSTYKAGVLYLLALENSHGSDATAVSAITGGTGAPTWTSRSSVQFNGNLNRISIWSAVPTAEYTGTLTVAWGGVTQTGTVYSLAAFYNVDTTTNDGIVQQVTNTGNDAAPTATLAAFGSANNATVGAVGAATSAVGALAVDYKTLSTEGATTPAQSLNFYYRPDNDTSVSSAITSAQWGTCALEVKGLGATPQTLPPMRGYLSLFSSGATMRLSASAASAVWMPHAYVQGSALGSGLGHPMVATIATAATSGAAGYLFGFTRRSSP